uniref:Glycosyltransferase n=1 Tax=Fagus sylvatica TaxID=28930 RepID=A0A2N9HKG7_FAGSY
MVTTESETSMKLKPHVAVLPSPGMGHIIPLLELAKRLVVHHGIHVSFLNITTEASSAQNKLLHSHPLPPNLHVIDLPHADLSALVSEETRVVTRLCINVQESLKPLKWILIELGNPQALIIDLFCTQAFEICNELSIPIYTFFTASTAFLALSLYFPTLDREVECEFVDLPGPVQVPGCTPVRTKDLMDDAMNRKTDENTRISNTVFPPTAATTTTTVVSLGKDPNPAQTHHPRPISAVQTQQPPQATDSTTPGLGKDPNPPNQPPKPTESTTPSHRITTTPTSPSHPSTTRAVNPNPNHHFPTAKPKPTEIGNLKPKPPLSNRKTQTHRDRQPQAQTTTFQPQNPNPPRSATSSPNHHFPTAKPKPTEIGNLKPKPPLFNRKTQTHRDRGGTLTTEQLTEFTWGLELSQKRFIFVTRKPSDCSASGSFFNVGDDVNVNDPKTYLPEGFLERTKGVGLVVSSWAPQVAVLSHSSTGAFLSHCGWNSTLESVTHGVPMIAWPLYAEQRMNATMLTEEVGVAVKPAGVGEGKGVVEREEIERVVRMVMDGEEGKAMRRRARELKRSAVQGLNFGGSSYESLFRVVEEWKAADKI